MLIQHIQQKKRKGVDDANQTCHHIMKFSYPEGGKRKGVYCKSSLVCGYWYGRYGGVSSWKEVVCKSFPTYIILYDSQNIILTIFIKVSLFVLITVVNSFSTRGFFSLESVDIEWYTFITMICFIMFVIPNFFNFKSVTLH